MLFTDLRVKEVQPNRYGNAFIDLAYSCPGQTTANLFRKQAVIGVGGWDESLRNAEDFDLMFRMIVHFGPDSLVYHSVSRSVYRQRPEGQLTNSGFVQLHSNSLTVYTKIYNYLTQHKPDIFAQRESVFKDMLYGCIYNLGIYDIALAEKNLNEVLGYGYRPDWKNGLISPGHIILYWLFGFKKSMQIRGAVKRLLGDKWKGWKELLR